MRKLLSLALIFTFSVLGCTNSEIENEIEENISHKEDNDVDYYVKYHYYGYSGSGTYCLFDITYLNFATSNSNPAVNTITYDYSTTKSNSISNEIICGPFKKGNIVSIEMTNTNNVRYQLLEIYVSKNNSPFALRKSTTSRKLEYTIDY